jgi:hypothetical protein
MKLKTEAGPQQPTDDHLPSDCHVRGFTRCGSTMRIIAFIERRQTEVMSRL